MTTKTRPRGRPPERVDLGPGSKPKSWDELGIGKYERWKCKVMASIPDGIREEMIENGATTAQLVAAGKRYYGSEARDDNRFSIRPDDPLSAATSISEHCTLQHVEELAVLLLEHVDRIRRRADSA